jgi:hypothetical protein
MTDICAYSVPGFIFQRYREGSALFVFLPGIVGKKGGARETTGPQKLHANFEQITGFMQKEQRQDKKSTKQKPPLSGAFSSGCVQLLQSQKSCDKIGYAHQSSPGYNIASTSDAM